MAHTPKCLVEGNSPGVPGWRVRSRAGCAGPQAAGLGALPADDFMADMPALDLGAMDLSEPAAALPPHCASAPIALHPGSQQIGRRSPPRPSLPDSPALRQHQRGPCAGQQAGWQPGVHYHPRTAPLSGWQPVQLKRADQSLYLPPAHPAPSSVAFATRSAPSQLRPQPLPAGLSSALRSQSIPDGGNGGAPPLWLSANGTASGSPPVRSCSGGGPPMSSIPEGAGHVAPPSPQPQSPHRQLQQHAYSMPLPGPGLWPPQHPNVSLGWVPGQPTVGLPSTHRPTATRACARTPLPDARPSAPFWQSDRCQAPCADAVIFGAPVRSSSC